MAWTSTSASACSASSSSTSASPAARSTSTFASRSTSPPTTSRQHVAPRTNPDRQPMCACVPLVAINGPSYRLKDRLKPSPNGVVPSSDPCYRHMNPYQQRHQTLTPDRGGRSTARAGRTTQPPVMGRAGFVCADAPRLRFRDCPYLTGLSGPDLLTVPHQKGRTIEFTDPPALAHRGKARSVPSTRMQVMQPRPRKLMPGRPTSEAWRHARTRDANADKRHDKAVAGRLKRRLLACPVHEKALQSLATIHAPKLLGLLGGQHVWQQLLHRHAALDPFDVHANRQIPRAGNDDAILRM